MFKIIARCLEIGDIIALTRTCKQLTGLYQQLQPLFWNIDRSLGHYSKDPKAVRSFMAKFNVLLGGNSVLQFLDRSPEWPGTVLRFYVRCTGTRWFDGNKFDPSLVLESFELLLGEKYQFEDEFRGVCTILTFIEKTKHSI